MAVARPQLQQRIPLVDKEGRLSNEGLRALNDAFQSIFATLDQILELYGITDELNSDILELAGSAVVLTEPGGFPSGRTLTAGNHIVVTDGGSGGNITISLGAITSDDVAEGVANLYFTEARARNSLSAGSGIVYDSLTGAIAVNTVLSAYAGGDTPSGFTLGIVDSTDAAAWRTAIGAGTVTSVQASGGTTGLSFSGGPITGSGTLTLSGTLNLANGGTGATTASDARTALGLGTIATQDANNVAITGGTVAGLSALGIVESGDNFTVDQYSNTSAVGANVLARRARGTSGSPSGVLSGNVLGGIYGAGWRDTGVWSNYVASVRAVAAEDFIGTANGTQLEFATTNIGGSSRSTRFTISPAGSLYSNVTPATGMTAGFIYVPGGAGVPTGAAETVGTNQIPLYYDRTNNRLYASNGGTWRSVALA